MRILRHFSASLLYRLGIAALARALLVSNGRFVLLFHGIAKARRQDLPLQVQPYITQDGLRLILGWLKSHFHLMTPEEFLGSSGSGVLLTFDDGLANNCTVVLPLLNEFEAPAIFFISTQHVTSPRNWLPATRALVRKHWKSDEDVPDNVAAEFYDGMSHSQLLVCASNPLITIGSHTVSHPFLTQCNRSQLESELSLSRHLLADMTGQRVALFAYPAGDYNREVAETVRSCGYDAAFAEDVRSVGLPAFEISRVGIYSADRAYLSIKLCGLHRRPLRGKALALHRGLLT